MIRHSLRPSIRAASISDFGTASNAALNTNMHTMVESIGNARPKYVFSRPSLAVIRYAGMIVAWYWFAPAIAPLLGLLGTVTGMISAFHVIAAKEGISTPTAITGGVAEALIATAAGLTIAIFTLIGYNHLQERIKHIIAEIEARGTAMVNVLADTGERIFNEDKRLSA